MSPNAAPQPGEPFTTWNWPLNSSFLQRRRQILERVVEELRQRDAWNERRAEEQEQQARGQQHPDQYPDDEAPVRPFLTGWRGHRNYVMSLEEYERCSARWERSPRTTLGGPAAQDPHPDPSGSSLPKPDISHARQKTHDNVRIALTIASMTDWRSFTNKKALQIALDLYDNVRRSGHNEEPTFGRHFSESERRRICQIAAQLGHFGIQDILTIATNYHLSLEYVITHKIAEPQAWLRQRDPISLAAADRSINELQQRARELWHKERARRRG